jgi:hypothetical protein
MSNFACFLAASLLLTLQAGNVCAGTREGIDEYRNENYEEALVQLAQGRATEGPTPQNAYYSGLAAMQTGDYLAAAENLRAALQPPEPIPEAVPELISVLNSLEQLDEALDWVSWAERRNFSPKVIALLKGQILAKQKKYADAINSFNMSKTGDLEQDQQLGILIAAAHVGNSDYKAAKDALAAVIGRNPNSDAATYAKEYDQQLNTAGKARPWNLFFGVNYQYDDNVLLKPFDNNAAIDTRNGHDSAFIENLRFEYDAPLSAAWTANVQYFLQNSDYVKLTDKNLLSHGLSLNSIHHSESLITALPVSLIHTALDYHNYSLQFSFKPTETILFAPTHIGQLSVGYTRREMLEEQTSADNDLTADTVNGSANYIYLYAEGQGMLNLRYEIAYEGTRGANWRNITNRIGADLLAPVSKCTKVVFSAESAWQDYYDNDAQRNDTTVSVSMAVNQKLSDTLFLNLQYNYSRAFSNVAAFDYQRNVITSGIELRF